MDPERKDVLGVNGSFCKVKNILLAFRCFLIKCLLRILKSVSYYRLWTSHVKLHFMKESKLECELYEVSAKKWTHFA